MRPTIWFVFLFGACGGVQNVNNDDTATAYAAALSVDSAVQESGLFAAIAGKLTAAATTGPAAANDAATITTLFMPQGCVTAQTAVNTVTYTLNKCTGPYGLLKLDGTITATFAPMPGGKIQVELSAKAFKISTVSVDVLATAVITTGVTQNSAVVTSSSNATNARGDVATHSGNYTAGWDPSCLTLNGTFTTSIVTSQGATAWTTQISNFHQCSGMCPDANGSVTVTGAKGDTVTVHYSNGGTAEVTTSSGTTSMILLACNAA
jgi:hypothetical protein